MTMIGGRKVPSSARDWAIVAGLFAVLAGVAAVWLAIDRLPPQRD
jgi:hypothetical protein